jgi:hypothetical protein
MARRKRFGEGDWLSEDDAIDEESNEPTEDDLITDDHIHFYSSGKRALTLSETTTGVDTASMWKAIDAWMEKSNYYPNVWFISDHGNAHLMERPKRRRRRR